MFDVISCFYVFEMTKEKGIIIKNNKFIWSFLYGY